MTMLKKPVGRVVLFMLAFNALVASDYKQLTTKRSICQVGGWRGIALTLT